VGEMDPVTPPGFSIDILSHVQSSVRELWIVEGAGHGGFDAPEVIDHDNFRIKTLRFFHEVLD
jgi:hypothetical protein